MPRRRPAEEDLLFDLPLDTAPAAPAPEEDLEQPTLPLEEREPPRSPEAERLVSVVDDRSPPVAPAAGRPADPTAVTLGQRFVAGLTDLGVCAAVLVLLLVALLAQGVRPQPADWPAGVVFLLAFSFLYAVLPLAFWGQTPGMALAGLRKSSRGGPLTFRQAILTWLGAVLTVAFAGLPLLLAIGGRSLSDLISGSVTRHRPS